MNAAKYFEELVLTATKTLKNLKQKLLRISLLRLFVFGLAVAAIYFFWSNKTAVMAAFVVFVVLFLYLVRVHTDLKTRLKLEQAFLENCQAELKILGGNWRSRDEGSEFINPEHPYTSDLNVFGKHSLFQFLNRSKTSFAKERLASWLQNPLMNPDDIVREKKIIADFAKHPEFLMRLITHAEFLQADLSLMQQLKSWGTEPEFSRSKWFWAFATYVVPVFAIAATVWYAVDAMNFNQYLLCLLVPGLLVGWKLKEHQARFNKLTDLIKNIGQFESLLSLIKSQNFESPEVARFFEGVDLRESDEALKSLSKVIGAIESRNNALVAIVLNLLLAWDFQCARRLNHWKNRYGSKLPEWFELVNTIETYASFSIFVFEYPDYNYAEFTSQSDFYVEEARHILMDKNAVPNTMNISQERRFMIITGANMAGKSTYLRTMGTTLLLAMRGLPVHAESIKFKPTQIFTSMLSVDSLGENASYFFNELRRLKQMIEVLEKGEPLFVILDEILKGTNSIDKAEGSKRFMEKLLTLQVKGLIATHDLSLCQLSDTYPGEIENQKFEVGFKDDNLVFDYKLEPGVCENMNASFLLEKMGLTP